LIGIAVDAELRHEVGHDAEEARVVEEAVLDQIVEAVGTVRRPVATHLDDKDALGGVEARLVAVGRLLVQRRGIAEVGGLAEGRGGRRDQHQRHQHCMHRLCHGASLRH
jgi:hypothetical protein